MSLLLSLPSIILLVVSYYVYKRFFLKEGDSTLRKILKLVATVFVFSSFLPVLVLPILKIAEVAQVNESMQNAIIIGSLVLMLGFLAWSIRKKQKTDGPISYVLIPLLIVAISIVASDFIFSLIPKLTGAVGIVIAILLSIVALWFIVGYFNRKLFFSMLRDKTIGNLFIWSYYNGINLIFAICAGVIGWHYTSGGVIVYVLIGLFGLWLYSSSRVSRYLKDRCPRCHELGHVSYKGRTNAGLKTEYKTSRSTGGGIERNSDSIVDTATYTTKVTGETYKMYNHNYYCNKCQHHWSDIIYGEMIGRSSKTRKKTETTTYRW